ncbi:acyltransferase [Nostoc sp. TCL26-01]|uniref:acyltransferase family protein n=1 Tax=Nostoc sp. TCL26-01 TaxID=2576904 RepID=UPI0015BBD2C3|nr:acyltransferase [Nostoc sp. TCL26-01]QLE57019.1 acyltransferase [Nostoc sp. TCL26-01]
MNNKINATRFNWIDQIKGLAILSIVLFHFFQNYLDRLPIIIVLDRNFAKIGYAAVDIFFVMAGLNTSYALISKFGKDGIEQMNINWKSWLQKRLSRIYPAYLLAVIITCLLYLLFQYSKIKSPINFVLSVIGIAGIRLQEINPGFWFFTAILEAYLITPLIFGVCRRNPQNILFWGTILGVITKVIALDFKLKGNIFSYLFFLQNNFIGSYINQYCLGLYWGFVFAKHKKFRKVDYVVVTIIFSVGFFVYATFSMTQIDIIYMLGFDMLFTPFMFLMIKEILCYLDKVKPLSSVLSFLSLLGIYSYQIYLIHQPLYFVLLPKIIPALHLNPYFRTIIVFAITAIVLIAYVYLFTRLEKYMMKALASVTKKSS